MGNKITLIFAILTMMGSIYAKNDSPIFLANRTKNFASVSFYTGCTSNKWPGNQAYYAVSAGSWGIKTGNTFPKDNNDSCHGYSFVVNWNGRKIFDSRYPFNLAKQVQGSGSILIKLKPGTSSPSVCINCF